jgi:hypothetical protein
MVEERDDLPGVHIDPVFGGVTRLLAPTVAEEIQQDDVLPASSQRPSQASVHLTVEEQGVHEHEDVVTLTVRLIREAPTFEDEASGTACLRRDPIRLVVLTVARE